MHDLQQPFRVVIHDDFGFTAFHAHQNVAGVGVRMQAFGDVAEVGQHVGADVIEFQGTAFEFRQVEDLVDEAQEVFAIAFDD